MFVSTFNLSLFTMPPLMNRCDVYGYALSAGPAMCMDMLFRPAPALSKIAAKYIFIIH